MLRLAGEETESERKTHTAARDAQRRGTCAVPYKFVEISTRYPPPQPPRAISESALISTTDRRLFRRGRITAPRKCSRTCPSSPLPADSRNCQVYAARAGCSLKPSSASALPVAGSADLSALRCRTNGLPCPCSLLVNTRCRLLSSSSSLVVHSRFFVSSPAHTAATITQYQLRSQQQGPRRSRILLLH